MAYVLKDGVGNYVSNDSIVYNKGINQYLYRFSDRIVNGFFAFPNIEKAQEGLETLKLSAEKIGFEMEFYIEEINMVDVITYEGNLQPKKFPIVHKVLNVERSIA